MRAFWQAGYEATSVTDLERATGLNKSSLYNAFGSKEGLYLRCLDRYAALYSEALIAELAAPRFRDAAENFLVKVLDRPGKGGLPRGCFVTMAGMEEVAAGGKVGRRVAQCIESLFAALRGRCEQAKEEGELPPEADCDQVAALLVALARGIAVLDRSEGGKEGARLALSGALAAIDGIAGASAGGDRGLRT